MFGKKERTKAQIYSIDNVSMMNPQQYISKGGYVCAGSDNRSHVDFILNDDTHIIFSLSNRQARDLQKGMKGTLIYHRNIFDKFEVCTENK